MLHQVNCVRKLQALQYTARQRAGFMKHAELTADACARMGPFQ